MNPFSTEDLEVIERDQALPGLRVVLDSDRLLQLLKDHAPFADITSLKLDYVRYKPGMNCLARYRIASESGPAWAYAKAFSEQSSAKLDKVEQRLDDSDGHGAGVVLRSQGVFASVFPYDFKLRSIARLANKESRDRLYRRLFDEHERWPGSGAVILNYKPERRLVMRLEARDGAMATVKCYTGREYARLAAIRKSHKRIADVVTPAQIGQSRKHYCRAFDWIGGDTLRARAHQEAFALQDHRAAGELIAGFHRAPLVGDFPDSQVAAPSLHSLAQQLAFLLPEIEADAVSLAQDLEGLEQDSPSRPRLIHGDFYDKQVIITGHAPGLIDLDCARPGDIHQDLACFLAHRERHILSGVISGGAMDSGIAEAFLDGYRKAGGEFSQDRLEQWVAWHLLRLSHHPFRDRSPDWPDQTHAMVARALQLLQTQSNQQMTAMV